MQLSTVEGIGVGENRAAHKPSETTFSCENERLMIVSENRFKHFGIEMNVQNRGKDVEFHSITQ